MPDIETELYQVHKSQIKGDRFLLMLLIPVVVFVIAITILYTATKPDINVASGYSTNSEAVLGATEKW